MVILVAVITDLITNAVYDLVKYLVLKVARRLTEARQSKGKHFRKPSK